MQSIRRHLVWLVIAIVGAFALGTVALSRGEAISALWIQGHSFRLWRSFGPIHLFSIVVLVTAPLGVWYARRHKVDAHRWTMISIFTGALVIAGAFTLVPGRIMHAVVFGP